MDNLEEIVFSRSYRSEVGRQKPIRLDYYFRRVENGSVLLRSTPVEFEWDETKAATNEWKHGVSFLEAQSVFGDPLALTGYDPDHSQEEDRFITMGTSIDERLLIVSHTNRGNKIRIISARLASRSERKDYEDGNFP